MSEKRRDHKGRILKTGESQRKDLTYQYRYTDNNGKRMTVYAPELNELREKEKAIQKALDSNLIVSKGNAPLISLIEEHIAMKHGIRSSTRSMYDSALRMFQAESFMKKSVGSVKPLEAKKWMIELHDRGYSYGTIVLYRSIVKCAYEMAIENDYVLKNPFNFKLNFIKNDTEKRDALTQSEQVVFLDYLANSKCYSKYYDLCVLLIETGIRIGELCGLTFRDVDFEKGILKIEKQIVRFGETSRKIAPPKSEAGCRTIPLTAKAKTAIRNIIHNRPSQKIETIVDGVGPFIFISKNGKPYCSSMIDHIFCNIRKNYDKLGIDLPPVTPHVLRHTFCTNMINSGVLPKHVQYLMGHADVDITMNVYTSTDEDTVFESMKNLAMLD